MKKFLLLIPALALIGVGCQSNLTTNSNVNVAVVSNSNTIVNENVNSDVDLSAEALAEVDTSDWKTYTNEEYGFSFEYPSNWSLNEVVEGGLGTAPGDIELSNESCGIHIDKPGLASGDIVNAFTTKELRGQTVETLTINNLAVLKQVGPVNTYGDVGDAYHILNDKSEVSLFVMQSGLEIPGCVKDYQDIVKTVKGL